jgi:hypothetical protein
MPEIRRNSETRNPNFGGRRSTPASQGGVSSGFGLRVCFGFRPSDFGLSFKAGGHLLQGRMQHWGLTGLTLRRMTNRPERGVHAASAIANPRANRFRLHSPGL